MMIIPIFISHMGCRNTCVFCNQREINGCHVAPTAGDVEAIIERYLKDAQALTVGVAFYGGSFTGLSEALQIRYLEVAHRYKQKGSVHHIRLSTRPDYIDLKTLERLSHYGVDLIELGVQSFDKEVLSASERGHEVKHIYEAIEAIKDFGMAFGIQLMFGLPKDNRERFFFSVNETIRLQPAIMRIYPTLVLKNTALADQMLEGIYRPWSLEEAVDVVAIATRMVLQTDINLIRIGLQATELISNEASVLAGPYHPAFRDLVYDKLFYDMLSQLLINAKNKAVTVEVNPKSVSHIRGQNKHNAQQLASSLGTTIKKIVQSETLSEDLVVIYVDNQKITGRLTDKFEV